MNLAHDALNRKIVFEALTVEAERKELSFVGVKHVRLQYIGKQECPGIEPIRLWNVICEGHPFHQSTRSLDGLKELGIVQ